MRVAQAQQLNGIDSVELQERPEPVAGPGQVLVRVRAAAIGPWDPMFLTSGFPGVAPPFVPGQEIAGVVEAAGEGADVQPGESVFASLFPAGGGFAELALASAEKLAPMPDVSFPEAAALVIGGGTALEGLVDRGQLQSGQTVLITAASGGVGTMAVQIAAAAGARVLAVASPANFEYLRSLGASEVFDYHDPDWAEQVRTLVPGGVDLLFDAAGGQTRDQALHAVRDGGRAVTILLDNTAAEPGRGITIEAFGAQISAERLGRLARLVDTGQLRPEVAAVLPLEQARQALEQVAGRHTRGKIVLQT